MSTAVFPVAPLTSYVAASPGLPGDVLPSPAERTMTLRRKMLVDCTPGTDGLQMTQLSIDASVAITGCNGTVHRLSRGHSWTPSATSLRFLWHGYGTAPAFRRCAR